MPVSGGISSIGPPPSTESYLDMPAIISAAEVTDAVAIHPGYGFLSENAEFARACEREGIVFIGPSPEAMLAIGEKRAARATAEGAGVPVVPGAEPRDQSPEALAAAARPDHLGGALEERKVLAQLETEDELRPRRQRPMGANEHARRRQVLRHLLDELVEELEADLDRRRALPGLERRDLGDRGRQAEGRLALLDLRAVEQLALVVDLQPGRLDPHVVGLRTRGIRRGIAGQLFGDMALTVTFSLLASLLVAARNG